MATSVGQSLYLSPGSEGIGDSHKWASTIKQSEHNTPIK